MSRIVSMTSVSLDGFMSGPDGELDWQLVDEELHYEFNEYLRSTSAFLSGRVTHELMASFWPTADADPDNAPPIVEFASIWRDKPKVVYSTTWQDTAWHTTIVRAVVPDAVRRLRDERGGDLALGGANLTAEFERQGLVDEYRLYVHPVLVGRGRRLFAGSVRPSGLRLLETRRFGSGVVMLRYDRLNR